MIHQLLFWTGNAIAIIGGFLALLWVSTSTRFYWRRRRRGLAALVFLAVGIFLMVEGHGTGASHAGGAVHSLYALGGR